MIIIVVATFIGFVVGVIVVYAEKKSRKPSDFFTGGVVTMFFCAIAGLMVAMLIGIVSPVHWESQNQTRLVSISNVQGVQASGGGIFILSFQASQVTYYGYWYSDQGGLRHGQLTDANDVIIYEDATPDTATLRTFVARCDIDESWVFCRIRSTRYEFHVPKGTVVRQFILNPNGVPAPSN